MKRKCRDKLLAEVLEEADRIATGVKGLVSKQNTHTFTVGILYDRRGTYLRDCKERVHDYAFCRPGACILQGGMAIRMVVLPLRDKLVVEQLSNTRSDGGVDSEDVPESI